MNKILIQRLHNVINMVTLKLFSSRMLFVLIVMCLFHDIYIREISELAVQYEDNVVPIIFPFLMHCLDFEFVFSLSVVYLFSDIPFMNRSEMYYIMRQGKVRWCIGKIISIFFVSLNFICINFIIDIVRLCPHISFQNNWDRILFSVANGVIDIENNIFALDIINHHTPAFMLGYTFILGTMVVFFIASTMFAISLVINRKSAILFGVIVSVMPIVASSSKHDLIYIYFFSPVSWIGKVYDRYAYQLPNEKYMLLSLVVFVLIDIVIIITSVKKADFMWLEEE